MIFKKYKIISALALLILLQSGLGCLEDAPVQPPRDNPWDPSNPYPPRAPDSLRARALSEIEILITWRDRSGNEAGFRIYQTVDPDTEQVLVAELLLDVKSVLIDSLERGTDYSYFIESFNESGSSYRAGPIFASTRNAPPSAPVNLVAQGISDSLVHLTWTDNSNIETGFEVEQSIGTLVNFHLTTVLPADCTSWTTGPLNPDIMHYFRVRSFNEYGASAYSSHSGVFPGE